MLFAVSIAACAANSAVLKDLKGKVQVKAAMGQPWEDARNGQKVDAGASIKTGSGAEVIVAWGEGKAIKVSPLSNIKLESLASAKSKINLSEGKIFARTNKLKSAGGTFEVRTPTAIAGVRGTGFEATPGSFAVVEGTVAVTAGGVEVIVEAGMMTEIPEAGAPPAQPTAIPAVKLDELRKVNAGVQKVADVTSAAGVVKQEPKPVEQVVEEVNEDVEQVTVDDKLTEDAASAGFDAGTGGIQGTINY